MKMPAARPGPSVQACRARTCRSPNPGYGYGVPAKDMSVEAIAWKRALSLWQNYGSGKPRRGRIPQRAWNPRMRQDPHRSRYHRVSSPIKGEHVEQDLLLPIDVRGESRERKDHVWMCFMNDVQVYIFTR